MIPFPVAASLMEDAGTATLFIAAVVAFIAGDAAVAQAARWYRRRGWVDDAAGDPLKIHATPVPTAGGVGILVPWLVVGASLLLVEGMSGGDWGWESGALMLAPALVVPAVALFALGFVDDRRGLAPGLRLGIEVAVAVVFAVLCSWGGFAPGDGPWPTVAGVSTLLLLLSVLFVVGGVNALNAQDGRDGVAGGQAILSLAAWGFVLSHRPGGAVAEPVALHAAILGGATAAFLLHNLPPARVYMGDGGSYLLGFGVAAPACLVATHWLSRGEWRPFFGCILLVGLPVVDMALAIVRRLARGVSPFRGDRDHLYDLMARRGWGPWKVLVWTWVIHLALVGLGASLLRRYET